MNSVRRSMAALAVGVSFSVGICGTSTADAATSVVRVTEVKAPAVVVTDNDVTINGSRYTQEQVQKLFDDALVEENKGKIHAASVPAIPVIAAGEYFVPGLGEVLLAATGAIIIGGVTIKGGSWLYHKIKNYLANSSQAEEISQARQQTPGYIKKRDGNIELGKFKTRVRGSKDRTGPKGWRISPDRGDEHRGSKWKVLDPSGHRKASVKDDGEIVGK